MRKLLIVGTVVLLTIGLAADVLLAQKAQTPRIEAERIRATVKYLSSDELEGRGTGQKGGDAAAEYIAAQFKSYGLKPAGEKGSYFQDVPMVGVKTLSQTSFTLVPQSGASVELKNFDDFVTSNVTQTPMADFDAPIVFVGYGITAAEYNWDDYKGVDLKGKVALLFVSEPESNDPKFFKGKALTYYGRWPYKFEETARHGAVATLIIHRTDLASYGWEVVRNSWGGERSYLKLEGTPKLEAGSWIQLEVAKKLVAMGGLDLDKLYKEAQSRDFHPIELPVKLKAHVASEIRPFSSHNVVGKVEGADAQRREEAVLYTAHYDHFGIDNSRPKGDNIYHGAIDNGTGCGILLELARVWAGTKPAPARTILFAAVTAEEQGLLGSEYFGKHPTIPAAKISLDLNYDALGPIGDPEEVEVSGAERTTFYPTVEKIAKEYGLAIKPDAHPEAGYYYRSDHFSLSRVGIPSFSISEGMKFKGHDLAWGEQQAKDYVTNNYHKPSDEYHAGWDFQGLAKMASFGYELGFAAADQPALIQWLSGDEFEPARKKASAQNIYGESLFAGRTDLQLISAIPLIYPPIARQIRIAGTVVARISVSSAGLVSNVEVLSGHPILKSQVDENLKQWQFEPQPGNGIVFDLECQFRLSGLETEKPLQTISVTEPLHIIVSVTPQPVYPNYSRVN
jgi:TonB family protein